jgi:ABC-2 type transport system permease protein
MRTYYLETKYEFLKLFRTPSYVLPTLSFPIVFYLFFGVGFGSKSSNPYSFATYLIATYGAMGVIAAALFGFGVTVANERGLGWLEVKRTTPMSVAAYFFAKMAIAMLFSTIVLVALFITAATAGGVHLPLAQQLSLLGILVPGSITFCALGLAIGCFAKPEAAPAIMNVIFLPVSFLSGLAIPIFSLPQAIQTIAWFLPPFHLAQLALGVIGANKGGGPWFVHVLALVISTAIFTAIAWIGFRRGVN